MPHMTKPFRTVHKLVKVHESINNEIPKESAVVSTFAMLNISNSQHPLTTHSCVRSFVSPLPSKAPDADYCVVQDVVENGEETAEQEVKKRGIYYWTCHGELWEKPASKNKDEQLKYLGNKILKYSNALLEMKPVSTLKERASLKREVRENACIPK